MKSRPIDEMKDTFDPLLKKYTLSNFGEAFDFRWFKAQAFCESTLNPKANSPVGAAGLMQIMPKTFAGIRKEIKIGSDIYDPETNIAAALHYNKYLFNTWSQGRPINDRMAFMFASYNAGLGNILKAQKACPSGKDNTLWKNIRVLDIPTWNEKETVNYVDKIFKLMGETY